MTEQPQMDQSDQAMMDSLDALGPLLMQAARYQRAKEEEPQQKRHRKDRLAVETNSKEAPAPGQADLLNLLQLLTISITIFNLLRDLIVDLVMAQQIFSGQLNYSLC